MHTVCKLEINITYSNNSFQLTFVSLQLIFKCLHALDNQSKLTVLLDETLCNF